MRVIILTIEVLITLFGFIPMFLNLFLYTTPILAPIIFILINYYIYEHYKNNNNALVYAIISEIFSFASYKLQGMAPGTDDGFGGLAETVEYVFYGCACIVICIIFLGISIHAINKYKLQEKVPSNSKEQEKKLPNNNNENK